MQKEFGIEVDWRGFELHPETPRGGVRVVDYFPAARAAGMRTYMEQFAARFGIHDMGSPERIPNTWRALAKAEFARDHGRLDEFRNVAMRAHWQQGKNLEDPVDLVAIARDAGLDPEAAVAACESPRYLERVDTLREEAHRMGVTGIPTFFFWGHRRRRLPGIRATHLRRARLGRHSTATLRVVRPRHPTSADTHP